MKNRPSDMLGLLKKATSSGKENPKNAKFRIIFNP